MLYRTQALAHLIPDTLSRAAWTDRQVVGSRAQPSVGRPGDDDAQGSGPSLQLLGSGGRDHAVVWGHSALPPVGASLGRRALSGRRFYTAHVLANQHPEGYWGTREGYFAKHTGTAWRWLLLHELGLDPMHPQMQRTADFLLDIAFSEAKGAFSSHPGTNTVPCYNGWLLWGLYRSGYGDDPRVRRALRWVVDTMHYDDGDDQVADPDNGCWGRHTCARGVIPIVRALAELPKGYRTAETARVLQAGIEFMLLHRVYKRSHNPSKPMNAKLTQLTFPGFYWPDFVEVLLVLTHLGFRDRRMEDAIAYLKKKQSKDGTWKLQRTYNERSKHDTFPVVIPLGTRGAQSKWLTLRALIVLKRWFGA